MRYRYMSDITLLLQPLQKSRTSICLFTQHTAVNGITCWYTRSHDAAAGLADLYAIAYVKIIRGLPTLLY